MLKHLAHHVCVASGIVSLAVACADPLATTPARTRAVALHVRVRGSDTPFAVDVQEQLPLEAIPVTADSTRLNVAVKTEWMSADTSKATVTADGVVHTRCVGLVDITATAVVDGQSIVGSLPVEIASTGSACAP